MTEPEASIIKSIIEDDYDIGEFAGYKKLYLGYINESYIIETLAGGDKRKFFLRKYRMGIKSDEICFEHSIINHLGQKGFSLAAGLIHTRDGNTSIKYADEQHAQPAYYALYQFITGDDRYTWDNPCCSNAHLRNSAAVLARYHDAVADLNPEGRRRGPTILELLPRIAKIMERRLREGGDNVFDIYLKEHLHLILKAIEDTQKTLSTEAYHQLPKLAIHGDFHPGNLKFQENEIVGLFDFDWSKIDKRAFDVALALFYFCTSWGRDGYQDGEFLISRAGAFLKAYQQTQRERVGAMPLSLEEIRFLPRLISASNLYVLFWALMDFSAKDVDAQEYLGYLRHGVCLIRWLNEEENWERLERLFKIDTHPHP